MYMHDTMKHNTYMYMEINEFFNLPFLAPKARCFSGSLNLGNVLKYLVLLSFMYMYNVTLWNLSETRRRSMRVHVLMCVCYVPVGVHTFDRFCGG